MLACMNDRCHLLRKRMAAFEFTIPVRNVDNPHHKLINEKTNDGFAAVSIFRLSIAGVSTSPNRSILFLIGRGVFTCIYVVFLVWAVAILLHRSYPVDYIFHRLFSDDRGFDCHRIVLNCVV